MKEENGNVTLFKYLQIFKETCYHCVATLFMNVLTLVLKRF